MRISRRRFLRGGAMAAAAAAAGVSAAETSPALLRVRLTAPDGQPLDLTRRHTLTARDLANDPLPLSVNFVEGGAEVTLGREPIALACRLAVPGFGEVYGYADNDGRGYDAPATIDFVAEAAKTRLRRVREAGAGAESEAGQAATPYESLAQGLHEGEKLVLSAARRRIARLPGPRKDFLFGGLAPGQNRGPKFERRFTAAFNFGAVSWYAWYNVQPESARIDYARMDQSLQWCWKRGITPKGYGYVYLIRGAMPEWLRAWPWEKVLAEYQRVVEQTARRYAGRLPFLEVINEAHDKANLAGYSHEQILELTRAACRAARRGAPEVRRLINHCCLWAEYARRPNLGNARRWSPFRYLSDCVAAGVEFERIGLQLYYPQQDLLEIERMLDRFKKFNRPLHISEMACNSAPGLDAASLRPKELVPGWHGSWSETMQADWVEAIYTLCYSKPEFEGAGWWDLADYGGHFWPHGGLLHQDFTPKESYRRLLSLKNAWGVV
jgi:hypothetical protein